MKYQFFRLYVLFVLISAAIIFSFSEIYTFVNNKNTSYQIDIEQIFEQNKDSKKTITMENIARNSIALPNSLSTLLDNGYVIKLANEDGLEFYYKKNNAEEISKYGPFYQPEKTDDIESFYVVLVFYSALALLLLCFIWPLFRDMAKLQNSATAFGEKLSFVKIKLRPSSPIYPLANTYNKMANQIVETMQMYQDLSRTMAHEIRTPLSRMKFLSEIISSTVEAEHTERLNKDIIEIQELMKEYLSFERLENHQYLKAKKTINVPDFLDGLAQKYQYIDSSITIQFNTKVVSAYFNDKTMTIALQNLINNALRYAHSQIIVEFSIIGGRCLLSVSDDGAGVGKEAEKLVQPFIRKEPDKATETGYGLGLYIARKVLIWHQGTIRLANSSTLSGAQITLRWPNRA
ncbi:ATP-binding protein [Colwellia sp. Arc7-D]|uniref:ATP-binding protein n=1 Tax=Colwellia sp. Arc7-D TaxID=2161872 RepID=UPI000D3C72EA|nr:ATP-binding protein [Colwellia sp. Arc7-D]AWB56353.1 hypothetical protein DBO93_01390 [Colwellia sp. Arc7-D]